MLDGGEVVAMTKCAYARGTNATRLHLPGSKMLICSAFGATWL